MNPLLALIVSLFLLGACGYVLWLAYQVYKRNEQDWS